ncbi:putative EBP domain protein [Pyronema omphalodes]|nr:putative EBP domain protein [Pyronema omphalodes]
MSHPYYPPDMQLKYLSPALSKEIILGAMGTISALVLLLGWRLMSLMNPTLTTRAKATASWFLYCGLLHIHFEGYFIRYRNSLASRSDVIGELWKEYALSDSRYLLGAKAEGEFVVGIEALTVVFLGPLCLLTFLATVLESPKRHPMRLIACCCHVYGVLLYYVTATVGGNKHCRPEFLYFWVYYVGCNIPWLIIPAILGWRSFQVMSKAVGLMNAGIAYKKRR